jgi:aryl-alcohol dehydrogenase-like predicted oxidoreductase
MHYRSLGRTGMTVSEIGFGAWGWGGGGGGGPRDGPALEALREAMDLGCNFIDTALMYGSGHSEKLIGQALTAWQGTVYVATKIPPLTQQIPARRVDRVQNAFPAHHIIGCTEQSLRNLRRDVIDLQQLHVWRDEWLDDLSWLETVRTLKEQGKIRAFGVSLNHHDPESGVRLAKSGCVDAIQVIFNIFDQTPMQALFPACREHQVGILVRVPLDEGGLTGTITPSTTFPPGDFRSHYFAGNRKAQLSRRVASLTELLGEEARTLPALALRYALDPEAVSTVLAGMRTSEHVRANTVVSDGRRLSEPLLQQLRVHAWPRNFYDAAPQGLFGYAKWIAKQCLKILGLR